MRGPRILNDEVSITLVVVHITDRKNRMIQIVHTILALSIVVETTSVVVEIIRRRINAASKAL